MGKFDTHGGFFSPKGYFRVNTGGSHEENPNGGVQIGVDQQGTPNMLEEDEPVYNDYVYSDNIKADAAVLKKAGIPEKYAGKLYSEIADKFVDEAEERPNDPISNNGLNAMLVRLAQAQEEQKQLQQQKELEEELANMSPEELAQLEAMMAEQEQGGEVAPETIAPEQIAPEQVAVPEQYAMGGDLDDDNASKVAEIMREAMRIREMEESKRLAEERALAEAKARKKSERLQKRLKWQIDNQNNRISQMAAVAPYIIPSRLEDFSNTLLNEMNDLDSLTARYNRERTGFLNFDDEPQNYSVSIPASAVTTDRTGSVVKGSPAIIDTTEYNRMSGILDRLNNMKSCGGKINKFDNGGRWVLGNYEWLNQNYRPSNTAGFIPYSRAMTLDDVTAQENSDRFKAWSQYVLDNWDKDDVQTYLRKLDATAGGNHMFDANGNILAGAQDYFKHARGIGPNSNHKWGYYHLTPDMLPMREAPADGLLPEVKTKINLPTGATALKPAPGLAGPNPIQAALDANKPVAVKDEYKPLPTWMRYAGLGINAAMLAHNIGQEPTRFYAPDIDPVVPTGSIRMVPQEYRQVDPSLATNALLAQGNATQRALLNSGSGPSTAASLVAADHNLTGALGTGFIQGWADANNRRNAVIAANNASEAQRANFDFAVDKAQTDELNRANYLRAQYNMMAQRLNAAEDSAEAQAISSQMNGIAQMLADIGRENFIFNQINSNEALRYRALLNGLSEYKGV